MSTDLTLPFVASPTAGLAADSPNTGATDLPSPKSFAVQFQTPTNADSPNHSALAGAITGIAVLILVFVVWELYRMRRRRLKFARSDAEAAANALPVYGRRDEKGGFMPPPSELPPPPPAYYSSSYVQRLSPPGYPFSRP
ncbi:hypothetical protein AURDEDRAFT_112179 [Auricularia subglabra TFB-10046 SS5]|nr:hypothetical protein AURDEDRAFT_112179 [Auricularia subglabra TFB-10046 SS5]